MLPFTDLTLVFTILVLVILIVPLVSAKIRVPDLVLLLLTGTALGPLGFGVLERSTAVTMFGEVGLLYIMFLAGLEIDLYQFMRTRRRSVGFGLLTFLIPQILGMVAVRALLGVGWPAAILIASMFASHTLLSYPIASRLGIHRTEPVTVTVGATMVTDTLALLVLAVVAAFWEGSGLGLGFWAHIGVGMVALVAVTWWGIPRLARWFFQNVTESGGAQFMFVLAVLCACAYVSNFAQLKPIIGAFLAGAAFNRLIPEHSPLMSRVHFVGHSLFIPFFLLSVGMLVDVRVLLGEPFTWLVIATMVGMVVLTKFAAAWIAGAWFGYSRDGRRVMFGLSVVQAAATLAAALVGFELEIIGEAALNGAIAMILVTCPLGSWVVDRYGRRVARLALARAAPARAEQRLVIPVANPASAARLMDLAFLLRDPAMPGTIHPLTVVREETDLDEAVGRGEKLLAQCMAQAAATEATVVPSVRVDLNPSDGIARAIRDLRATLVLAGWGGELTAGARIFGTVNRNLSERCPSRLMLCRLMRPLNTTRTLRIPFPPLAEHRSDLPVLIREAKLLARQVGASLHVYVAGPPAASLRTRVEDATPAVPCVFTESDTWAEARGHLTKALHPDDLLLLPLERRNAVLWTPTLDRLPDLLAGRFPANNLLVVYPSLAAATVTAPPEPAPAPPVFPDLRPVDLPDGLTAEAAIHRLCRDGLADAPDLTDEAAALLLTSARTNPVEIAPGIVLVHAHVGQRDGALALVGRGQVAWSFPQPATPPKLLVALLSPKGHPPEIHLRALAALARRFRDPGLSDRILAAATATEVGEILANPGD